MQEDNSGTRRWGGRAAGTAKRERERERERAREREEGALARAYSERIRF